MLEKHFYIRDARESKRAVIRDLVLSTYAEYEAVLPPLFWAQYRQNILETFDAKGAAECIVAEWEGTIVGCVLFYPPVASIDAGAAAATSEPFVRLLSTLPEMRGQGVGTALMDECKRRAYRSGATVLVLHTMSVMQTAMRMYERMGFVRAPELDFNPGGSVPVMGYRFTFDDGVQVGEK